MRREKAHAKVNLGLEVLGKRSDGYHELDTVFARLELHDTLELEPAERGVALEVVGAALPTGPGNLAYRAAERYLEAVGEWRGVSIRLTKRIPVAAGLGGGSSDAAAVLRGLKALYPAGVDLFALGRALGADVPFFLTDWPAARALGIGERFERLELPELHLVLVNPGVAVRAQDAYGWLVDHGGVLEPGLIASLSKTPRYRNSLQPGVLARVPVVGEALRALEGAGLRGALMSGSGATCFALAEDAAHAARIAGELAGRHLRWWARATRTVGCTVSCSRLTPQSSECS